MDTEYQKLLEKYLCLKAENEQLRSQLGIETMPKKQNMKKAFASLMAEESAVIIKKSTDFTSAVSCLKDKARTG